MSGGKKDSTEETITQRVFDMCPSVGLYCYFLLTRGDRLAYSFGGLVSMETDIPLKVLGSHRNMLSLCNGLKYPVKCLRG